MKPTTIEFSFDDAKLDVINIFLKDKNATLNDELEHFMDSLYKDYVPQEVRSFIEKKEAEEMRAASPKRVVRKKPSTASKPVSGEETYGGTTARPSEEKPV
jgi:hypothetical protein